MPRKPEYDREVLIDRACDLFWSKGWAGTSMKDLENTLGLKPGSFYAAFGSKAALYELTLERYAQNGMARLTAMVAEHGPLGALQTYPMLVIDDSAAAVKACMLAKTVLELRGQNDPLADCANAHLTEKEDQFANVFQKAQEAGQISTNCDPLALARRYQSDLLGMRVSAERSDVDAHAIAQEISDSLARLAP